MTEPGELVDLVVFKTCRLRLVDGPILVLSLAWCVNVRVKNFSDSSSQTLMIIFAYISRAAPDFCLVVFPTIL